MILDLSITYYISGPMTGLPDYNYPAFKRATSRLRRVLGLNVISPHEIPPPVEKLADEPLWRYYMDACMEQMNSCQGIIMLRGWPNSRGARAELQNAFDLDYKAFYLYAENPGKLIQMHL